MKSFMHMCHGRRRTISPCTTHPEHASLYSGGTMTDLGTLAGNFSYGEAINTTGAVAGYSVSASGAYHAFLDTAGKMTDLGAYNIDLTPSS
jgi:probable HAF family extracellular repeat protein